MNLTAEQKVRLALTGDPQGEPSFETEGPSVVRWLTGGSSPDLRVTFHHPPDGGGILVRCATCGEALGIIPDHDNDGADHAAAVRRMREAGHPHTSSLYRPALKLYIDDY